jgi:dipeptidase
MLCIKGSIVCWERPISTYKSIVSFVSQSRNYLPNEIGGTVWFSPHSSRTGCYTPFVVGQSSLPIGFTSNSMNDLNRGISAFWAYKYLYNIVEQKASYMINDVQQVQQDREINVSLKLKIDLDEMYLKTKDIKYVEKSLNVNAEEVVSLFWTLSDKLVMKYADGFCNGDSCGSISHHIGYPQTWIDEVYMPPLDMNVG